MATGDLEGARQQLEARKEIGRASVANSRSSTSSSVCATEALRELERIEAMSRTGFAVAYDEAAIYTALSDLDRACERLEHALTDGSVQINWMRLDPRMDALRGRKCFVDVEKRLYGQ